MRIRVLVLDLDGVITDGTVLLLESGEEVRSVHFHDLDAVGRARRRGVHVAILSGEDNPSGHRVAARFGIVDARWGAKDKLAGLLALSTDLGVPVSEMCYVGDGDRDAPALAAAGVGIAPVSGTTRARAAADHVVEVRGGHGAVAAAVEVLEASFDLPHQEEPA